MTQLLKIYLAGPMTNCSKRQKTEWRKRINSNLSRDKYHCLDPTGESARKGALVVTADIEEADVVIANMWRESIGTTIGIIHARRVGIPVVLIDPNYIDSPILESILEKDFIVHDEGSAIKKLENEIFPLLTRKILVRKTKTKTRGDDPVSVPFNLKKLQNFLKKASDQAGFDNPIFHIRLSRRVQRAIQILAKEGSEAITTDSIRNLIFAELNRLRQDSQFAHEYGEAQLRKDVTLFEEAWRQHEELYKPEKRALDGEKDSYLAELENEIDKLNEEVRRLELANFQPKSVVTGNSANQPKTGNKRTENLAVLLDRTLGTNKVLCVSPRDRTSFFEAFKRNGMTEGEFQQFFLEERIDGRQSNLNFDLQSRISSHPYVLYVKYRHLSSTLSKESKLISGCSTNDAVRKFTAILNKVAK